MKTLRQMQTIPEIGVEVILEGTITRLFFDFVKPESEEEEIPEDIVACESIDVEGQSRDAMISAIINDRYNNNSYQAISANYELAKDPESQITPEKRAEYLAEHAAFQDWRAHAKVISGIARSIIESIPAAE